MEKIEDVKIELLKSDYIENNIISFINNFMIDLNIDNIIGCNENTFNASIEKFGKSLNAAELIHIDKANNILNICFIDMLCDVYMYVCKLYNKTSSAYIFSKLVNINYNIITKWKIDINTYNNDNNIYINELYNLYNNIIDTNTYNNYINMLLDINTNRVDIITTLKGLIFSKLHTDREQTIKGKLSSYSQPVGLLSVVNKDYQWTAQQVQSETTAKVLSLSELPKIETLFKQ